jgi:hypothetical protein
MVRVPCLISLTISGALAAMRLASAIYPELTPTALAVTSLALPGCFPPVLVACRFRASSENNAGELTAMQVPKNAVAIVKNRAKLLLITK